MASNNIPSDWVLYMKEEEIQNYVKKCADEINERFKGSSIILTCILKGAVFFCCDLAKYITVPYSMYFIEASSYKNSQIQGDSIQILNEIVPEKFVGRKVVLVDELYDNGTTMELVKRAIAEKTGISDVCTVTVFKKRKDSSHTYLGTLDIYGVEVHNVWFVGYGLDFKQEMRGLPCLYAVPKASGIPKTDDDFTIFGK